MGPSHFRFRILDFRSVRALTSRAILVVEIFLFSLLVLVCRCANYEDVFVNGEIYFSDADCYSRMTRVRMCLEHPGLIIRHHSFENFPAGTTPHTTAPFDYFIVALAAGLTPFTSHSLDLAGAIASPLLGLFGGWFLWWWSGRMRLRHRGALLLLYALSPILVHGTELGRPDHQSALILLLLVAVCSEWILQTKPSRKWSLISGTAWGLALWVSFYEPVMLFAIVLVAHALFARENFTALQRRPGWILLACIVFVAFVIERRIPVFGSSTILSNWSATIGELKPLSVSDPTWLRWAGLLLIPAPALIWIALRRTLVFPIFIGALLVATFALTIWEARWAYFFVAFFAAALPALLSVIQNRWIVWAAVAVSMLPILSDWDGRLWPNESSNALRLERRREAAEWRAASKQLVSGMTAGFLAPWWLSPAVAYWSGQPGVAGSSHESIAGIETSARFFLAPDAEVARKVLVEKNISWVLTYDAERLLTNSAAILGVQPPNQSIGGMLDRTPSRAPSFLRLAFQNGGCKVFRVRFSEEKDDFPSVIH